MAVLGTAWWKYWGVLGTLWWEQWGAHGGTGDSVVGVLGDA